jgi:uncharacterized membrane-anchored protein
MNKIIIALFVLVSFVQLYVPAKMIYNREVILREGSEFKFKSAPIDPSDLFRGKYLTLQYDESLVEIETEKDWQRGETVYVILSKDPEGFAKIQDLSKTRPEHDRDYLKTTVEYFYSNNTGIVRIHYPFNRFYMEESKAYSAELLYRDSQADDNQTAYALVSIMDGEAVLKDVMINGVSIIELAKNSTLN